MTRSKVVKKRTDLATLFALPSPFLNEGPEGCSSGSETGHDDRLSVEGRQLQGRRARHVSRYVTSRSAVVVPGLLTFMTEGLTETMTLSPARNLAK